VLVPRHEGEYAEVGVVASVAEHVRLPGGGHAVNVEAEHAPWSAPPRPAATGRCRRGRRAPRRGAGRRAHALAVTRVPRRGREILELRGVDARSRAGCARSASRECSRTPAATAPTSTTSSARAAADDRRQRPPRAGAEVPARALRGAADPQAHPRRRAGGRGQAAARLFPAQADGLDRKELGDDDASVVEEYRTKIEAAESRRRPASSAEGARRLERMASSRARRA